MLDLAVLLAFTVNYYPSYLVEIIFRTLLSPNQVCRAINVVFGFYSYSQVRLHWISIFSVLSKMSIAFGQNATPEPQTDTNTRNNLSGPMRVGAGPQSTKVRHCAHGI